MQHSTEYVLPAAQFSSVGRSCEKCTHLPVCGVYRAIAPMMDNWNGDGQGGPFETKTLAAICREYAEPVAL